MYFSPESLTGLTNGGNDYGYSQWHYQEDDRFGWSAHFQDGQRSDRGFGKSDRGEERAYGSLTISASTTVAEFLKAVVDNNADFDYGDRSRSTMCSVPPPFILRSTLVRYSLYICSTFVFSPFHNEKQTENNGKITESKRLRSEAEAN